ncbi:ABC transporter permease [Paenibacillus sp. GCM10027629]|uniref:ABC transporter permease n=1 Tax=Paenibacillus sp. GCM10027629 TaxID=3273414 RepID=UPI00363930FA
MNSIKVIIKEHVNNIYLISRLSAYELKKNYISNRLGLVWLVLNPLIQIFVYWMVFGLGIRGGAPVNGVPFFIWLLSGLIPWFFVSSGITQGSNSIYGRIGTVSKMNFPLSIIITVVITAQLYTHVILLIFVIILISIIHGISVISLFGLIYYVVSLTCFLIALGFVTSTLSSIVRDIQLIVQAISRMLFFLTPVMWTMSENTPIFLKKIIEMNPLNYIISGYRSSLIWGEVTIWSVPSLLFWCLTFVLFILGAILHVKFRRYFVDYS